MANIEHVVVLMMENRSFDEYFGTFPGAAGFNDTNNAQAFNQPWASNSTLQPFRKSTFTGTGLQSQQLGHDWMTMHIAAQNGAGGAVNNMNFYLSQTSEGWSPVTPFKGLMSYFVANDIPYHWALAENFALCDNYFCSVLAGTETNRLFLTSGVNYDPKTFTSGTAETLQGPTSTEVSADTPLPIILYNDKNQATWQSYLADLHNWQVLNPQAASLYRVYDDSNWNLDWNASAAYSPTGSLNTFASYPPYKDSQGNTTWLGNGVASASGAPADANCFAPDVWAGDTSPDLRPLFAQHVLPVPGSPTAGNPYLATLTWIFPPPNLSEHPPFYGYVDDGSWSQASGAYYLAQIVDSLMGSTFWEQTALIITYDESDTHFDHVPPPVNTDSSLEPFVLETFGQDDASPSSGNYINYPAPIGAGMRVPAIIVSPWAMGKGVCHDPLDHTSILRLMATVSGVPCKNGSGNPANDGTGTTQPSLYRQKFANLADVIANLANVKAAATPPLPAVATVKQILANATTRFIQNAQEISGATSGSGYGPDQNPPDVNPPNPPTQPIAQSIELILPVSSYDLAGVTKAAGGQSSYTIPAGLQVVLYGFEPNELTNPLSVGWQNQQASGPQLSFVTPTFSFTNPNVSVNLGEASISPDPTDPSYQPPNWPSGKPCTFTITYPLTLSNISELFPPQPSAANPSPAAEQIFITGALQLDGYFRASAEVELVSSPDPQFYHDFTEDISWLSAELRVFSVEAGGMLFGVPLETPNASLSSEDVALKFITGLLDAINLAGGENLPLTEFPANSGIFINSFDELNQLEEVNPLYLTSTDANGNLVFNFALARVHLNSPQKAQNVRVFFRMARASVTTGQYDATGSNSGPSYDTAFYRSNPATGPGTGSGDVKIPLFGVMNVPPPGGGASQNEIVSVPFFAVKRVDATVKPMFDQLPDTPNQHDMPPGLGGAPGVRFYGCWLDINQGKGFIPAQVPPGQRTWDGPYSGQLQTFAEAFAMDMHQCLVAEISVDGITIPTNDIPGVSAWLAQRNLGFVQ